MLLQPVLLDVFPSLTEVSQAHLVPIFAICIPKSIVLELSDSHSLPASLPSPLTLYCSPLTGHLSPARRPRTPYTFCFPLALTFVYVQQRPNKIPVCGPSEPGLTGICTRHIHDDGFGPEACI
jgi:hypothetical protein